MFRHRRGHRRHLPAHRLFAGAILAAYLVALSGLPVSPSVSKDRSVPFPCQDHACGCRTAEDCWRHCCCHSLAERLAWARTRGLEPPSYAVQPAVQGCAHCGHAEAQTAPHAPASQSCCAKSHDAGSGRTPPAGPRRGFCFNTLRCQGLSFWLVGMQPLSPPPVRLTWTPHRVGGDWLADADVTAPVLRTTPPDPPPRSLSA